MGNNKGFTLAELTVASGVAAVVTLALSSLMVWAVLEFEGVKRRLVAQAEALRLEIMLRKYVTPAIKVKGANLANGNTALGNGGAVSGAADGQGRFAANFNHIQLSDWPGTGWQNVALFLREGKEPPIGGPAAQRRSLLVETAIVVRAPTATTSGVVFIDSAGDNFGGAMTPDWADQWVGGIVEFQLDKKVKNNVVHRLPAGGTYTDSRVVSVLMNYKLRYHMSSSLPKRWCPTADVTGGTAGCGGGAGYVDIQRSVRIVLPNNNLGTRDVYPDPLDYWIEDRPLGFLHLFRPVIPDVWSN